jgi:1-deoxy-D-xylulose-5-phosphate reductoisomerase
LLDFTQLPGLTFRPADAARYPGLQLAWDTLRGPEGSTAVLNAANEVAVAAFLAGTIRFDQIHSVNARCLDAVSPSSDACRSVAGLLALDADVRRHAESVVGTLNA